MPFPLGLRTAALTLGIALLAQTAFAQPDFTRKERKACTYCHVGTWTSGKLTEAGAFYATAHSFKNFVPKAQPLHAETTQKPAPGH